MAEKTNEVVKMERRDAHPYHVWESVQKIPGLLSECLNEDVEQQIKNISREIARRRIDKLFLLGRGSSYFLTLSLKYLFNAITNYQVSCYVTNLFESYPPINLDANSAVFFHSTSGNSEGDARVVELAKKSGAYTIGVTDISGSILAKTVDDVLMGPGGAKFELPASRTYATALFRMSMLTVELARQQGNSKKADALMLNLNEIPEMLQKFMPAFEEQLDGVVKQIEKCSTFIVIGFGPNIATADETALALSQGTGMPAVSYEVENFIHGPIQALDSSMGVVVIANDGPLQDRALGVAMACKTIGAKTIVLYPEAKGKLPYADVQINLPITIGDTISPIVYMVPMWQLAYRLGLSKKAGHPDRLRMDRPEFIQAFKYLLSQDKWVAQP